MAVGVLGFSLKRSPMAAPIFHLLLLLLLLVSCGGSRFPTRDFMTEPTPRIKIASTRRELAENNTTALNATTNLGEDAEVLLLFKAALTSDPFNVTRYWKPIGKRQLINPCRPWTGITCTRRRVTAINLANCSLAGALPASLGRLSALLTLNLSSNRFSGPVPPQLSLAFSLQALDLGGNELVGAVPASLGDLTNLTSLVVSSNQLVGALPTSIANLVNLRSLNLSRNNLSGGLPPQLANLTALEALDVSGNDLSGGIPDGVGEMVNLTVLDVSRNGHLSGSIPATLGQLLRLERLHLASCNFTGTIPPSLANCTRLRDVDLSNNRLRGSVPFQSLHNLTVLHLQNNFLEGEFVSRLPSFVSLEDVDVRNNRLNGSIPEGVRGVPLQEGLLLGRNALTGVIPEGLGELALVKRIDLSANGLSGGIPDALRNCISLEELELGDNLLSGGIAIPEGALPALVVLNVSYNSLNGTLPSLSHLMNLRVFDGSVNRFSGGVSTTFVDFGLLQWLNVSTNVLSGEVPAFRAHDNVTKLSFLNNTGLCGAMLGVGCGDGKLAVSTIVYIALGSAAGLVAAVLLAVFLVAYCRGWSKGSKHSAQVSAELQLKLTPEDVVAATNEFSEASFIGEGKLSRVYRGVLPDQTVVAVKRLAVGEVAEKSLDAELEVLGHIRHRSLVKVLGYCSSAEAKALVVEYMPHGSLEGLLRSPQTEEVNRAFDWTVRFKIAVEVAEGLTFLHSECRQPVVHGDVKPSNILFDANMEARVADFGVRRILSEQGLCSSSLSSTPAHGYTPSEVAASGVPTIEGDVYSFGIIMLEMVTGRDPSRLEPGQTLPQWVRATVANSKALQNVLDPVLMPDLPAHQQKMAMMLGVALLCTRSEPQDRPSMNDVYRMLAQIRSKTNDSSRRKGLVSSGKRTSSVARRSARELQVAQELLPHTPSLSDWTPPTKV